MNKFQNMFKISKFINIFERYLRGSWNSRSTKFLFRKCSDRVFDKGKTHHLEAIRISGNSDPIRFKFTSIGKLNSKNIPYLRLHLSPEKYQHTWENIDILVCPIHTGKTWAFYYLNAKRLLDFLYGINKGVTIRIEDAGKPIDIQFRLMYRSAVGVEFAEMIAVDKQLTDKIIIMIEEVNLKKEIFTQVMSDKLEFVPENNIPNIKYGDKICDREKGYKFTRWSEGGKDIMPIVAIYKGRNLSHTNIEIYNQVGEKKWCFKDIDEASDNLKLSAETIRLLLTGEHKTFKQTNSEGKVAKFSAFDNLKPYTPEEHALRFQRKKRCDAK